MNDSTLPPSQRVAEAGNRTIGTSGGKTGQPKTTSNGAGPRKKVPPKGVKKGFALHDWMSLQRVSKDLAQRKGVPHRDAIAPNEIRKHNDVHDAWISLRGKVYNITAYLHYHPGGVAIFNSVLGKDASVLFDKYHRWVNIDGLIGCLLLGYLAPPSARKDSDEEDDDDDEDSDSDDEGETEVQDDTNKMMRPNLLTSVGGGGSRSSQNTQSKSSPHNLSFPNSLLSQSPPKRPLSSRSLGSTGSDGSFEFHVPAPRAPSQLQHMPHLLHAETTESRLDDDKNPWERTIINTGKSTSTSTIGEHSIPQSGSSSSLSPPQSASTKANRK